MIIFKFIWMIFINHLVIKKNEIYTLERIFFLILILYISYAIIIEIL
jgi:hypothetical protein